MQAMELGLIPIMVRPPPESDFLQQWVDYPGPIFNSWPEAMHYMHTVDSRFALTAIIYITNT
jgi:hypothetical protein